MADNVHRESEIKLSAWVGFALPDLSDLAEGVSAVAVEPRMLDAVYYDTADLRLARWGITVRYRSGDGSGWTVKLPEGDDGPALVRSEVTFASPAGAVPADVADLVRAYVRRTPLVQVAHMRTRRWGVELRNEEGQTVAEVVDDEVTVLERRRVAARFREVEVEIGTRAPAGLIEEVIARLKRAGAGQIDATPKVVRALGARALAQPEVSLEALPDDPTAGEVVRGAMAASVTRILRHDAGVRIGDDPEDVHQARVGTRRLRSDLRTFAPLVDSEWAGRLRSELGWLAAALGEVRDTDVLLERLRRQAGTLPELDAAGFAPILRKLADQREAARARLLQAMSGERYLALLDDLVAGAHAPALTAEAAAPARELVPHLVSQPWKHLRKAVDQLGDDPDDEALHEVRIRAKRVRYAAEAAAPAIGKPARKLASAVAGVQGVLGDHNDAIVAEAWLREAARDADPVQALAAGELVAAQREEAAACRKAWRKAWKKADDKKLRSWLQ